MRFFDICIAVIFLLAIVDGTNPFSVKPSLQGALRFIRKSMVTGLVGFGVTSNVLAVSGGGTDFANKNLKEEGDFFVGKTFSKMDFTQCDASGVSFKGSKLTGSRFFKSKLFKTDFTSADLTGVSLEDTGLEGSIFKDAILQVFLATVHCMS